MNITLSAIVTSLVALSLTVPSGAVPETQSSINLSLFETRTGIEISQLIQGTDFRVRSINVADPLAPWIIKIDNEHRASGTSSVSEGVYASIRNVERLLQNSPNDTPLFSEGVSEEIEDFLVNVQRVCSGRLSTREFLADYPSSPLASAIATYLTSDRRTNVGAELAVQHGVQWKAFCDAEVRLLASETESANQRGRDAWRQIDTIEAGVRASIRDALTTLTQEEQLSYRRESKLPRRAVSEGTLSDGFFSFAENVTNPRIKAILENAGRRVADAERPIYIDRELIALRRIARGRSLFSFLLYGSDHTMSNAIEEMRGSGTPVNLIRIGRVG